MRVNYVNIVMQQGEVKYDQEKLGSESDAHRA